MSAQLNDGGPAFPVPDLSGWDGMSLLDYFAGQALIGMLASEAGRDGVCRRPSDGEYFDEACARGAYSFACAMLAERELRMRGGA